MRKRSKIGAALCGLLTVLAACGGGGRLSAVGYARAATKLCEGANRAVGRTASSLPSGPVSDRALARVVAIHRRSINELEELRPPKRLAGAAQRWIALLDQGTDELERMRLHLRAGHDAEATAYGEKAVTLLDRAGELVEAMGVTSCRGPRLGVT